MKGFDNGIFFSRSKKFEHLYGLRKRLVGKKILKITGERGYN